MPRPEIFARARQWALRINGRFWFRPAMLVLFAIVLADILIHVGEWSAFTDNFISRWLYNGGEQGARMLLGTIAGSALGVAGTTFSITIATLTLASNQMGPRLLRNFTEDHGNQYTLGVFLGTFAYALVVLGSVRGGKNNLFVPHMAVTGAMVLAIASVAMLVYFVNHIASRINADALMEVVFDDFQTSIARLSSLEPQPAAPEPSYWTGAGDVVLERHGYVQYVDEDAIAGWAEAEGAAVHLLVRPGDFVFPNTRLAQVLPSGREAAPVLESAITFGIYPTLSMDLEFAVSQLVDIGVRSLSPGINDPHTAMRVLDHLGAGLCLVAGRHLTSGVKTRNGRVVYARKITDYGGLTDAMFHILRQNADRSPAVRIRLIEVLAKAAEAERDPARLDALERHGELMRQDGARSAANEADTQTLLQRLDWLHENLLQSRAAIGQPP